MEPKEIEPGISILRRGVSQAPCPQSHSKPTPAHKKYIKKRESGFKLVFIDIDYKLGGFHPALFIF